ncbi:sarcosine oxidase subunit gamma [Sphingopyxis sp.]|uniref:sarcosine oxidase subunit gamma n=1 Tax=Sphingopyxis sp. TaxID=1908224 RepID=UPI0025D88FF9|nr:sarcosine oxidase subunit gamma family protein [Sphingopyxis sp.]MBR2173834.1 hypothetical protein [Sphingopyxis sp.]
MSDTGVLQLAPEEPAELLIEASGVRFASDSGIGMAKLHVRVDQPDRWFEEVLGIAPPAPLAEIAVPPLRCAWLAPGEWLITGPWLDVEHVRSHAAEAAGTHGLMVDLTHARAAFELRGATARMVLAAHCPLDLSNREMPVGAARRSLFSETGFFISRQPDRDGEVCFRLIFDQTMAGYAQRMLAATIAGVCA